MNVVILSARRGWQTDELCRALAERGHIGHVLPYEGLVASVGASSTNVEADLPAFAKASAGQASLVESASGTPVLAADIVLPRIIPSGSLEQIVYRVNALHWIERRGITVVNSPRAIERCVDKFYTTVLLHEAGLPVPETVVCEGMADAMAAVRRMGSAVVKPIFGSMGHGIVRVDDPDVAFRVFKTLDQIRAVFYVQRAIDHGGRDVRVFVVGGRVVAAIERLAPAGEWRTNVSQGATARRCALPASSAQLALRAVEAVGADYAGVDLLQAPDGSVLVIEVNGIPGWQGLQEATGVDVAGEIVSHAIARARDGRPASAVRT
jgi:RimK family alpha-L-glutamate ligase